MVRDAMQGNDRATLEALRAGDERAFAQLVAA